MSLNVLTRHNRLISQLFYYIGLAKRLTIAFITAIIFFITVLMTSSCTHVAYQHVDRGTHELYLAQMDLDAFWPKRAKWHLDQAAYYLSSDDKRLLLIMAYYQELMGQFKQAEASYNALLRRDPNQAGVMNNYGVYEIIQWAGFHLRDDRS